MVRELICQQKPPMWHRQHPSKIPGHPVERCAVSVLPTARVTATVGLDKKITNINETGTWDKIRA
jgi:hypothetical protein